MGVGKSSLIAMLLGTQRELIRISTPVATKPLHLAPAQDTFTLKFGTDWQEVSYERLSRMIAHTSNQMFIHWKNKKKRKGKVAKSSAAASFQIGYFSKPRVLKSSKKVDLVALAGELRSEINKALENSLTTSSEKIFTEFHKSVCDEMKESNELLMSYSIRVVDSGGLPHFHDIVSIFVPKPSGLISVFKLNEYLGNFGEVAFHEEGMLINDPYEAHYTNKQVICHDVQVVHSEAEQRGIEEMPYLAFVGTFLDEQMKCYETPDQKDEQLHNIITEILPQNMHQRVITSGGSLSNVTFRINSKNPGDQDRKKVGHLKESLMTNSLSRTKFRKLPLKWFSFDVALQIMMKELNQHALSRKECESMGYKLGFDHASLEAALDYLHQLNIIAYYEVLPNVIFGSSQVILDKITELVCYSLKLKKQQQKLKGQSVKLGMLERKFVEQGILSIQFLNSPELNKHYIANIFQPEDLLKVLISQLVVTEVGLKEFIMPCVLEVSSIYPSPPIPEDNMHSSFILHFSKKSPIFGVYCCTISSLLSDAGWKLLTTEDGEVMPVARNCFTFKVPDFPGKLTFLDPISSYFEVNLEVPVSEAPEQSAMWHIRDAFVEAIMKAMETLHYDVQVPNVSFLCPEQSSKCSIMPHPAGVDSTQSYLICPYSSSVHRRITEKQKMWLPQLNTCESLNNF